MVCVCVHKRKPEKRRVNLAVPRQSDGFHTKDQPRMSQHTTLVFFWLFLREMVKKPAVSRSSGLGTNRRLIKCLACGKLKKTFSLLKFISCQFHQPTYQVRRGTCQFYKMPKDNPGNIFYLWTYSLEVWLVHSRNIELWKYGMFARFYWFLFKIRVKLGKTKVTHLYLQLSSLSSVSESFPAQKGERPPETIMNTST